ncbi:MAG TPA: cell division protein CrgA [Nocardioidaceae bacterium]|nr:cell division protein CrgA [Nocardioidaceae bacterium]
MPESRSRKKSDYTPPTAKKRTAAKIGNRWAAPAMLVCWLVGLAWVSVFYIAGDKIPVMDNLGNWNIIIGMGLIAVGFIFATKWE